MFWKIFTLYKGQDQDEEALEEVLKEDQINFQPLYADPEILEELIGSDEEKQVRFI